MNISLEILNFFLIINTINSRLLLTILLNYSKFDRTVYKYISGIWDRKHKDFCYQSHQRNFPSFSTENNRFLYQVKVALLTILVNTTGNQQTNAVPENSAASTNGGTPKVITNNKSLAMNLLLFKKKKRKRKRCYYVSLRKTVP